ncbi:(2Fe-2S)-binding protein [Albimonas sp. CAU 1670]|uniref:(2Fe-2S)-binding protein n=1 Tax=Albimonas sp. CAU 1670 TaxID=3032599 RepID=UPI0023DAE7C4|nr:(2Fe-2S)-binding protein [Albimonas sp. CAU 1670]MDF2230982.1 (2Fe-2S)-binding protein [Albimonas sp. CAU 1670]
MIRLRVNGETRELDRDPMTPLIDLLRRDLGLTGAKAVCREGFCGACTVHVEGEPRLACLTPAGLVEGAEITTIEGLGRNAPPSVAPVEGTHPALPTALQRALLEEDAVQCGMCFPGMVMALAPVLEAEPGIDREGLRRALTGNLCRCTGYERILDAALRALRPETEAAPAPEAAR